MPSPRMAPSRSSAQRSGSLRATPGMPRQRLPWLSGAGTRPAASPAWDGIGGVTPASSGRRRSGRRPGRPASSRRGAHDLVVIDRTGHGEHHPRMPIAARQCSTTARASRGAPNRWCPRSPGRADGPIEHLVEEREDVVGGRVDVHPDLVDDDRLLGGEIAATQQRAQGELTDRLQGDPHVLGRHLGAVDRELSIGAGVHAAADALDELRQEPGIGVRPGSLEDEMLEEVAEAGVSLVLVPRADRHEVARRSPIARRASPG